MTICERVKTKARGYWLLRPEIRSIVFPWLEDHVMECNGCALALEKEAQAWSKSRDD